MGGLRDDHVMLGCGSSGPNVVFSCTNMRSGDLKKVQDQAREGRMVVYRLHGLEVGDRPFSVPRLPEKWTSVAEKWTSGGQMLGYRPFRQYEELG